MTAATFKAFVIGALAFSAAALSAGCNLEPDAVAKPTYEADVRPIFMSRCIRCHGYPPLADPTSPAAMTPSPFPERFDVYGDTNCDTDAGAPCIHGAAYMAKMNKFLAPLTTLAGQVGGMPPAPAPRLTSYQQDTILKWEAEAADGGTPLE
jgi:hypothetical protein